MELLLILFPLLALGGLASSGGGGDDGAAEPDGTEQTGTDANELLAGAAGADVIAGAGGNDLLIGADGADLLTGEAGSDALLGGAGADKLNGGTGNDYLQGGAGHDNLDGGNANDTLIGGSGSDSLSGGNGSDILVGLEFAKISDALTGVTGELIGLLDDSVSEGERAALTAGVTSGDADELGADVLHAGDGDDTLIGDDGDTLTGGAGDDRFGIWHDPAEQASVVTDFDPARDLMSVLVADPATATFRLEAGQGESVRLLVNDALAVTFTSGNLAALTANGAPWLTLEPAEIA